VGWQKLRAAFAEKQKSISFLASMTGDLIRNLKLHIIFPHGILTNDMQSFKMEIYGCIFNRNSKKRIISSLSDRQFDTQSEIANRFLARNPYK
jgi:hypothetical protein